MASELFDLARAVDSDGGGLDDARLDPVGRPEALLSEVTAELAMLVDPEGEEPVIANTGALRVAGRYFQGTERWLKNRSSDGRIAVARLIGFDEESTPGPSRVDRARRTRVHAESARLSRMSAGCLVQVPIRALRSRPSKAELLRQVRDDDCASGPAHVRKSANDRSVEQRGLQRDADVSRAPCPKPSPSGWRHPASPVALADRR